MTKKLSLIVISFAFLVVLAACQSTTSPPIERDPTKHTPSDKNLGAESNCGNVNEYTGKTLGDGHCVAFVRACAKLPITRYWRPGQWVAGNHIKPGTVIATFVDGKYLSESGQHAAVFVSQNENGIWVYDQWLGRSVGKRLIRYRQKGAKPANRAQDYRVVLY